MLKIQIAKQFDGTGVPRCIRPDDSSTWQKQTRHAAAHFALHDLTHYAVETVFGYQRGFFGLIAEGWDLEDTTGKGRRGPFLPRPLRLSELLAALIPTAAPAYSGLSKNSTNLLHEHSRMPSFTVCVPPAPRFFASGLKFR